MFTRKRMLILVPLLLVGACAFELVRELQGPNASTAYRWVFDQPKPRFVTSLQSDYYSHLKGYGIYLTFVAPPMKLNEIIDTESSRPLYREDVDYLEPWHHEHKFREMLPGHNFDIKACRKTGRATDGEAWSIVYNPTNGSVYCFYLSDSDIKP